MDERRAYVGDAMSHAALLRRQSEARARQDAALHKVDRLMDTQRALGQELSDGMRALGDSREQLGRIEAESRDGSLFASLVRPFTARRTALARRSVTEALLAQHQKVSVRLREATAFADELHLTALELQQEVERLHRELAQATDNHRVAAQRVLAAEAALNELERGGGTDAERERSRDRLTVDLKLDAVALELYAASAEHCRTHLPPARALRDTVLKLHADMAAYVLDATHTVNAAGRRIQGLGVLADAPRVVAELQASLTELRQAMEAAQQFVDSSRSLVAGVLPEIAATLRSDGEAEAAALEADLRHLDRERTRRRAEQALRSAAEAEVERLLGAPNDR